MESSTKDGDSSPEGEGKSLVALRDAVARNPKSAVWFHILSLVLGAIAISFMVSEEDTSGYSIFAIMIVAMIVSLLLVLNSIAAISSGECIRKMGPWAITVWHIVNQGLD